MPLFLFLLPFFFLFSSGCDLSLTSPLSTPPAPLEITASIASYYWGRLILYDLLDNTYLDASVFYDNYPIGVYPYLRVTPNNRIPLICPGNPKLNSSSSSASPDDLACCGVCAESPGLLAIFTLLVREHNNIARTSLGDVTTRYNAGRDRILSLLNLSCPYCAGIGSPEHIRIIMAAITTTSSTLDDDPALGSIDPLTECDVLMTRNLSKIGRQLTTSVTNGTDCWDAVSAGDGDTLPSTSYVYSGDDVMVYLLGEPHGPDDDDVLGPFSRGVFLRTINASGPVWLTSDVIDGFVGSYCVDQTSSSSSSSSSSCSNNVTTGSMIFFVVVIAILTVTLGSYVIVVLSKK